MFRLFNYLTGNTTSGEIESNVVNESISCIDNPIPELMYQLKCIENVIIAFHTQHIEYVPGSDAKEKILDLLKLQQQGIENLRNEIHSKESYDLTTTYFMVRDQEIDNFKSLCHDYKSMISSCRPNDIVTFDYLFYKVVEQKTLDYPNLEIKPIDEDNNRRKLHQHWVIRNLVDKH